MKLKLAIIGVCMSFVAIAQGKNDTIQVIAKQINLGVGSKIHIAQYEVIKVLKGNVSNKVISVGYYFYNELENAPDTALLNLTTYTGGLAAKDYFIFPEYDQKKGSEKILVSTVEFKYWEGCEIGRGPCKPLIFHRDAENSRWFLIMPCGGTSTSVTLSDSTRIVGKVGVNADQCPPVFELTNLKDGIYLATMLACGLGGSIEFLISTNSR